MAKHPRPRSRSRYGPRFGRVTVGLLLGLLCTGCPRRFDPRAEEIHSPSSAAESAYQQARAQLQAGDPQSVTAASDALARFPEQFPQDPLLPQVTLLRARTLLKLGQAQQARELLEPLAHPPPGSAAPPDGVSERARFALGLCLFRLGDMAGARGHLQPFAAEIVDSEDGTALHAVLAELYRRDGNAQEALREYDRFYHGQGARPAERAYVREQVVKLLPALPPGEQRGTERRFELAAPAGSGGPAGGAGLTVGLVLPLTGRERALGERVLHGALSGAGVFEAQGLRGLQGVPVNLLVRDSGSSPEQAGLAVEGLAKEGAAAIVGSPARAEAAQIAAQAARLGLPLVDLSPPADQRQGITGPQRGVFHLLRGNAARAEALAGYLQQQGIGSVAVLAPASPYGKAVSRAFLQALQQSPMAGAKQQRPVRVLASLSFAEGTTTFTAQAQELLGLRPEALFVPASAQQLELIAAQLAATGVIATQNVPTGAGERGRGARAAAFAGAQVLATAEGLGERLLRNAGRYLQGAVLAPISVGRSPLAAAGGRSPLAELGERYRRGDGQGAGQPDGADSPAGQEPGALDALGYDAVRVLQGACAAGPCGAGRLLQAIPGVRLDGSTGSIAFDEAGQRAGAALLLRVEGDGLRELRPAQPGSGPVGVLEPALPRRSAPQRAGAGS